MIAPYRPSEPVSIVREGHFEGDLLERLNLYNADFEDISSHQRERYALYIPKTPSLIIITNMKKRIGKTNGYASFSSYSQELNLQMLDELKRKTGLEIRDVDNPNLISLEIAMSSIFEEVVRNGLDVLKSR